MPKIDVYDINGKKVKELELNEEVFGIEPNEAVVHSVLVNFLANQRQGFFPSFTLTSFWKMLVPASGAMPVTSL